MTTLKMFSNTLVELFLNPTALHPNHYSYRSNSSNEQALQNWTRNMYHTPRSQLKGQIHRGGGTFPPLPPPPQSILNKTQLRYG